jgi:hypothetical protein
MKESTNREANSFIQTGPAEAAQRQLRHTMFDKKGQCHFVPTFKMLLSCFPPKSGDKRHFVT